MDLKQQKRNRTIKSNADFNDYVTRRCSTNKHLNNQLHSSTKYEPFFSPKCDKSFSVNFVILNPNPATKWPIKILRKLRLNVPKRAILATFITRIRVIKFKSEAQNLKFKMADSIWQIFVSTKISSTCLPPLNPPF